MEPVIKAPPAVPGVKPCCLDVANLRRVKDDPPFTTDTCQVCKCKHIRLDAQMGNLFNIVGAPLGGQE